MAAEPRKRSRFDQTEPEPKRPSRFDRRSRSPANRSSESRRSRSPLGNARSPSSASEAAAAAAAAAARINAQIQSKKGSELVPVPSSTTPTSVHSPRNESGASDIYQQDGDYIKDIEVNDLRNRYTLTKGATQKMIKDETGADVTTRGSYYPDKSMATPSNPPLYLHVTSTSREGLEKAIAKINDLMQQDLPNLVDERRFRRREPEQVERDEHGRRKWPEEKIPINLEPIPGFNLRAQVVGHGGSYVKHIQQETRCRVQIKGRGSGFNEKETNMESDEPMYLHVTGPDAAEVQRAKELCEDLLTNVRDQYQSFKERGAQRGFGGGGYGQRDGRNGPGGQGTDQSQGTPQAPGGDAAAQWAQYYAAQGQSGQGQDPYAAYGGYENYVAWYNYYYQYQQQQQGDGTATAPGMEAAQSQPAGSPPAAPGTELPAANDPPPPPPPADEEPPPPPPPPGAPPGEDGSSKGYNAMPPPPGL